MGPFITIAIILGATASHVTFFYLGHKFGSWLFGKVKDEANKL